MIKYTILLIIFSSQIIAREIGQTEITTDEGIEVFQDEKYYLLKKNVNIISDEFNLTADLVKAFFEKDLYDITKIECNGNVTFDSNIGGFAKGEKLDFIPSSNLIEISGINSSLTYNDLKMTSNEKIIVNDSLGTFNLQGKSSNLQTKEINIFGNIIFGKYQKNQKTNEILSLTVIDEKIANIITDKINMFASKAIYSKNKNIIELFENVKILRNNEVIMGDFAQINTLDNSYKINSTSSNKVKILINSANE